MMDSVIDLLSAGDHDATAIAAPGRGAMNYDELRATIDRLAGQLRALGVSRGDRVATVLPNGGDAAITFLAISSCATAAPLNPRYREDELRFYMEDVGAAALITLPGGAEAARATAPEGTLRLELEGQGSDLSLREPSCPVAKSEPEFATPDDVALVLHTSGTTSRPKIVPLTGRNLATSAGNIALSLALTQEDRCLNVMPLFHIHGLVAGLLSPLRSGGSVAPTPGFDAFKFFDWLDELAPTWYTAVPTMHQLITSRGSRHKKIIARTPLRFARSSSASLPTVVLESIEEVMRVPMIEAYGMTEASHQMTSNPLPPDTRKPASVGTPTGIDLAIMDRESLFLPPGERGEVVIKGATVTEGYENNPDANEAAFTGGWFHTGDQGYLDEDGYLFLTGRLKELINRGGEKVSPLEIDEVLLRHPAITQAVAFAMPHKKLGEEVAAAIVLIEEATLSEREVRDFCARQLADFKVPRVIVFVDEIPKGPTGKLQRIGLAEKLGM